MLLLTFVFRSRRLFVGRCFVVVVGALLVSTSSRFLVVRRVAVVDKIAILLSILLCNERLKLRGM